MRKMPPRVATKAMDWDQLQARLGLCDRHVVNEKAKMLNEKDMMYEGCRKK
jgi:hypothetical protein